MPNLDPRALFIADRDTNHGAAVGGRRFDLIRRFEMRIEPPIGIHAGIEAEANIVRMRENAIDE